MQGMTLEELKDFCTTQLIRAREKDSRYCLPDCPLMQNNGYCMMCRGPAGWDLDEIEKRVKRGE